MCQTINVKAFFVILMLLLMTLPVGRAEAASSGKAAPGCGEALADVEPMFKRSEKMVVVTEGGQPEPEYVGLTDAGINRLAKASQDLLKSHQILTYGNFEMEN